MNNNNIVLSIYTRPDCHLCDDMLNGLKKWQEKYSFDIQLINIDLEQDLTNRYAARIPVLVSGDNEICQYYLDNDSLSVFFNKINH